MTLCRYIVADVFDGLAKLDDQSVDLVFTSPPFLALRSYLPADHPDKAKEIGSEPTPAAFIDTLLDVVEALEPKMATHGSICFELGDTYSGSGGAGGDYNDGAWRHGQPEWRGSASRGDQTNGGTGWPQGKSLCLIPESFRWALAYGRNPFNGRTTPPWRVRNVIRWHRPNPPVGALGDKVRPSTSDIVVACKSRTRYFDLDAVRTEPVTGDRVLYQSGASDNGDNLVSHEGYQQNHPAGAPPLDTWIIPTQPYRGSHYATFPDDLVAKPVKMMCPERVCRVCGEPSRRIVEACGVGESKRGLATSRLLGGGRADGSAGWERVSTTTLGWTDCGHSNIDLPPKLDASHSDADRRARRIERLEIETGLTPPPNNWRKGLVLDPFAGSGTVLGVAIGHGRDAIGIDLDERNAELARERVGMWLTVEHAVTSAHV